MTALVVVALGTSLTAGLNWQAPLAERLQTCLQRPVEVQKVAASGATSRWGLAQVTKVTSLRPDVVLIEFAVNDANWRHFMRISESRANTISLVRSLRGGLPEAKLFLMTTNPVHGLRGVVRPHLASYYEQYRTIAGPEGVRLIDLERAWLTVPEPRRREMIPDGAHPTLAALEAQALPLIAAQLCEAERPRRSLAE